jgi:hypothetical protein
MKNKIIDTTEKLSKGIMSKDEANKILLGLFNDINNVCDCNDLENCNGPYKSCRKCGKLHSAWKKN